MFKVIIIDDDAIIRKGLRSIIDWRRFGFSIAGEAKNGEEGLSIIEGTRADLIITDVKMPSMDGLEMIRKIRATGIESKIIIVTAFKNFEYAKTALQYDVSDLVLKPTNLNELTQAVAKVKEELEENIRLKREIAEKEKLFRENLPVLKERFLHDLTFGIEDSLDTESDRLALFEIKLDSYVIVICRFAESGIHSKYEYYLHQFGVSRLCSQVFSDDYEVQRIQFRVYQSAFILSPKSGTETEVQLKQSLRTKAERLISVIQSTIQEEIAVGISDFASGTSGLNAAYRQAEIALEKIFYTGSQIVLEYNPADSHLESPTTSEMNLDGFLPAIQGGNSSRIGSLFESLVSHMKEQQIDSATCRKIFGELFWKTFTAGNQSNDSSANNINLLQSIIEGIDIESIAEKLKPHLIALAEGNKRTHDNSISDTVNRAKAIIESSYNTGITLTSIAEGVFVSPSYLSRIFRRKEGLSFNEYVNTVRMRKAIHMLQTTELKSYEIAERVGIADPHYFSKTFKRITGKSPSDYRQEKTEEEHAN